MVRQPADETNRIAEQQLSSLAEVAHAGAGVECGKKLVVGQNVGAGERIHERGLAGISIADETGSDFVAAGLHLARAALLDVPDVAFEVADPLAHQPAVGLDLAFARPAHADAALDPLEMGPHVAQPRKGVLELREFNLVARHRGARAARKDVKDQFGAINDLAVRFLFEGSHLCRAQVNVHDDDVGVALAAEPRKLFDLALAQEGGRMRHAAALGAAAMLDALANHHGACGCGQAAKFFQRIARKCGLAD